MSKQRSRNFLRHCAETQEFDIATGGSLRDHVRMSDREAVLRFSAFRLLGVPAYKRHGSMDAFLLEATRWLDDPTQVTSKQLDSLVAKFRQAMGNAHAVFGVHAFRKWEQGQAGRNAT